MTRRERVNSPGELRAGDRVELVDDEDPSQVALIDLLWWDVPMRQWCGIVAAVSGPNCTTREGDPMLPGDLGTIGAPAYGEGCVFIRRRAREGLVRTLEVTRG